MSAGNVIPGTWAALDAALVELSEHHGFAVYGPTTVGRACCMTCSRAELDKVAPNESKPQLFYHAQDRDEEYDIPGFDWESDEEPTDEQMEDAVWFDVDTNEKVNVYLGYNVRTLLHLLPVLEVFGRHGLAVGFPDADEGDIQFRELLPLKLINAMGSMADRFWDFDTKIHVLAAEDALDTDGITWEGELSGPIRAGLTLVK